MKLYRKSQLENYICLHNLHTTKGKTYHGFCCFNKHTHIPEVCGRHKQSLLALDQKKCRSVHG